MSLGNWAKNSWLKPHRTSKQEIQGLFSIVQRGLQDSQIAELSSDGKFMHAYRASFTLATILLYSSGYAPASGQSHHYRTIIAIPEILGDKYKDDTDYLNECRSKRNAAEYDAANEISETEANELIEFTKEFQNTVRQWVQKNHRELA